MSRTLRAAPRSMTCSIALASVLVLAGCGDDSDSGGPSAGGDEGGQQGRILESGFGQRGEYVYPVTLVENTSDHGGQSVTVSWNFLDSDGEIVKSESHLQSFSFPGQTIAVITQVSVVEGVEVASIEPTLLIEDLGYFPEGEFDLGIVDATIRQNARTWSASFPFENPTSEILQSPSADIVCWDAEGTIIGGGFEYPDLVPANGEILVDATLLVSGEPATCKAFSEARCSVPDG